MTITKNMKLLTVNMTKKNKEGGIRIMFAALLSWLGNLSATMGTQACSLWFIDEPKMPKSLLNK